MKPLLSKGFIIFAREWEQIGESLIKFVTMFFRTHYSAKFDLGDLPSINLTVPIKADTHIVIQFSAITKEQLKGGQKLGDIICNATVEKKFTQRQTAKFESLTDEKPQGIRETVSPIIDELRSAVKRAVRVFIWKRGYFKFTILLDQVLVPFNSLSMEQIGDQFKVRCDLRLNGVL